MRALAVVVAVAVAATLVDLPSQEPAPPSGQAISVRPVEVPVLAAPVAGLPSEAAHPGSVDPVAESGTPASPEAADEAPIDCEDCGAAPLEAPAPVALATAGEPEDGWLEERAHEAVERIRYPWQDLGYDLVFVEAERRGLRGMIYRDRRRIEIYVHHDDEVALTATDVAHEIGHAVDFTHGDAERRRRWRELRGIDPDTPWFGCSGCEDFATPAGDYAEVFAYWQIGRADLFKSRMGPVPSSRQLAELIPLMQPRDEPEEADPPPDEPDEHDEPEESRGLIRRLLPGRSSAA